MKENLHQSEFNPEGLHREVSVNKTIILYMHCGMGDWIILMFIGSLRFLSLGWRKFGSIFRCRTHEKCRLKNAGYFSEFINNYNYYLNISDTIT